jgi:mevalonate pyrophosphate decarboxylase
MENLRVDKLGKKDSTQGIRVILSDERQEVASLGHSAYKMMRAVILTGASESFLWKGTTLKTLNTTREKREPIKNTSTLALRLHS